MRYFDKTLNEALKSVGSFRSSKEALSWMVKVWNKASGENLIDQDINDVVLGKIYRSLSKRVHPDINNNPNAKAAMSKLSNAFEMAGRIVEKPMPKRDPKQQAADDLESAYTRNSKMFGQR